MPFFTSNDFRLHFHEVAQAAPRDTIFLHGNLGSNAWWTPMEKNWKHDPQYQESLLFMEWRGSGQSQGPRTEQDLQMTSLADDVANLAKTRRTPVNIVGHSTGGLIAALAMARHPESFHRAVLLDPVGATGIEFPPELHRTFQMMKKDKTLCGKAILSTIYDAEINESLSKQIVEDAFATHPLNWSGVLNALKGINFTSEINQIQSPTLVLHGEFDQVLPIEHSEHLAALLPHGVFHKILGRGHSTNVENPALFTQLVQEFLFIN